MSKKAAIVVLVILTIAIIAVGVYWFVTSQRQQYDEVLELTLGAESSLLTAAVWVAEERGYFEDAGLDIAIEEFDSGRLSFLDMLEGGVNISTVAPTPIMFQSFERDDFQIFSTFVYSDDDLKVIARGGNGISDIKDLVGKKIGTPSGTTGQFFLAAFLTYGGLRESDVQVIDLNPSELPGALASGQVDAIVIWEPYAYNAEQLLGNAAIQLPSSEVYRETFNFMAMDSFAEANPEALERFIIAIDKATEFIQDNKENAQEIVAEHLGLDSTVTAALWDDFVFDISLSQSLVITLEDEAMWAVENSLVDQKQIPNYLDYIYFGALDAVSPGSITIIR
ncbi:MAG: ABC transporter substrate-binding protein [bacterium]